MRLLLCNDDGYDAPGILALQEFFLNQGDDVFLIAPERNRSACSSSLTVRNHLKPVQFAAQSWKVINGTPADCVHLAINGFLNVEPDAIISGINDESNLGDDTLYSGTVAAAIEARKLPCPKIAVSIDGGGRFQEAAQITASLLRQIKQFPQVKQLPKAASLTTGLSSEAIFNINIPNLPTHQIKGWKITRLGQRLRSHPIKQQLDEQGDPIYFIGAAGESHDHQVGTDFEALDERFISVTPISTDLTCHQSLQLLSTIVDQRFELNA